MPFSVEDAVGLPAQLAYLPVAQLWQICSVHGQEQRERQQHGRRHPGT